MVLSRVNVPMPENTTKPDEVSALSDADATMPSTKSDDDQVRDNGAGEAEGDYEEVSSTVSVPVTMGEEVNADSFLPTFNDVLPFLLAP